MKVRFNTFETNSSSAHTFVMRNESIYTTDAEIKNYLNSFKDDLHGYVPTTSFMGDDSYGRGFELLNEWFDKMSYMVAITKYSGSFEKVVDVVKKRTGMKGICSSYSNYDNADITEASDCSLPLYSNEYDDFEYLGSVDHQSYDNYENAYDALRKHPNFKDKTEEEIINDIIFSNRFVIVVDSDETATFDNMCEQGFFETAGFSEVLYSKYCNDPTVKGGYYYDNNFIDFDAYFAERDN